MSQPARLVLLGAGASKPAEIPTSTELVHYVVESLKGSREGDINSLIQRSIQVALGGIRSRKPLGTVDAEELYQVLRELNRRREGPLAPFVGAWHENVTSTERYQLQSSAHSVARALADDIQQYINSTKRQGTPPTLSAGHLSNFEAALEDALTGTRGDDLGIFATAANYVLQVLFQKCWIAEAKRDLTAYLRPLVASSSESPLRIATLNYDNTVELAAARENVEIDTGVRHDAKTVRFDDTARVSVAKLHGSLNWALKPTGELEVHDAPDGKRRAPTVIFGGGNKLRVSGPYLDLLFAFRSWLEATSVIEVCGYSFRDTHVNYLIYSWVLAERGRRILVSDPNLTIDGLKENFDAAINEVILEMFPLYEAARGARATFSRDWYRDTFQIRAESADVWAARARQAG